jgi:hypothetical protein
LSLFLFKHARQDFAGWSVENCNQPDLKFLRDPFERSSASAVSPAIAFEPIVTNGCAAPGI